MPTTDPCLVPARSLADRPSLGGPLVDRYLEFFAARCRPNTLTATTSDLRAFFAVVDKAPTEVVVADVFDFITAQRHCGAHDRVVRLADGESGLAARTIKRRLSSVSGCSPTS